MVEIGTKGVSVVLEVPNESGGVAREVEVAEVAGVAVGRRDATGGGGLRAADAAHLAHLTPVRGVGCARGKEKNRTSNFFEDC